MGTEVVQDEICLTAPFNLHELLSSYRSLNVCLVT